MEEGIIEAQKLSANVEKGTGVDAVQQKPRMEKMTTPDEEGNFLLKFPVGDNPNAGIADTQPYGAHGNYSVSLNGRSSAQAKHATAIGNSTVAIGDESLAQGYAAVAKGGSSFAGGSGVTATGEAAVAHGMQTQAKGKCSTTIGARTVADGEASFAGGVDTKAEGYASTTFGQDTIAKESNQTVVGQCNDSTFTKEGFHSVFQVGCGSYNAAGDVVSRINGLNVSEGGEIVVYWNGGYYRLTNSLSIFNNILNMVNNTDGLDCLIEAKIS
jgi:hypothetical protein